MTKYNTTFKLSLTDMDVIEKALRAAQDENTEARIDARSISEVLGKLHNQKLFYRPSSGVYVSG